MNTCFVVRCPVPWTIQSEIFPTGVRGKANGYEAPAFSLSRSLARHF